MTRTSTARSLLAPTARTVPLSSTWSSLAWSAGGHLANLVEEQRPAVGVDEEARARRGRARERALHVPEKLALEQAPRASAAQLTATKDRAARELVAWMARASAVLPVPVSPASSTGRRRVGHAARDVEDLAHRRARGHQAPEARRSLSVARSVRASRRRRASSSARSRKSASSSVAKGFVR